MIAGSPRHRGPSSRRGPTPRRSNPLLDVEETSKFGALGLPWHRDLCLGEHFFT